MAGLAASEREILEGCRARDSAAALAFIERFQHPLLRVVVRLVGRWPVAEEIVQETFFRAFREIDRIDASRGLRGWLYGVALNLTRDYLKHGSRAEVSEAPDDDGSIPLFARPVPDPAAATISAETRNAVEQALLQLTPKLRELALLRYVEGLSFAEISQVLNVPDAVLRMRALRARAELRRRLQEWIS